MYNGQPLSYWVEVLGGSREQPSISPITSWLQEINDIPGSPEAQEALQHIGTNAIPYLVDWIGAKPVPGPRWSDTIMLAKGAPRALRALGSTAAPALLTIVTNKACASLARGVALESAVSLLGTNAHALLPLALQCAEEGDDGLARAAVLALGIVGAGRPEALEVLEKSLQDPWRDAWRNATLAAVAALGNIGVPTLARELTSKDPRTRHIVGGLLVECLPHALTNTAVLAAAADNLRSADEDRRLVAAELLWAADQQARGEKPELSIPRRERENLLDSATNILRRLAPQLPERTP
jgi:HEAT repeat protein